MGICGKRIGATLVFAACISFLGCGKASNSEPSERTVNGVGRQGGPGQPGKEVERSYPVRPVHWKVLGPPQGSRVRISSEVGYCVGGVQPKIQTVRIREEGEKVLITALVTVPPSEGEGCAGVGLGLRKTVNLKRRVGSRPLFDASSVPPLKRWPLG